MAYVASSRRSAIGHPIVAAFAAGAIFVLAVALGDPTGAPLAALVVLAPIAAVFGFVVAILPCLIGSAMLHALGEGNVGVRLPVVWGLVGGLTAGGGAAAVSTDAIVPFAATGLLCALICRAGARWPC